MGAFPLEGPGGCGGGVCGGAPSCYVPVCRGPGTDRRSPMSGYVGDGVFVRSREAFARAEQWLAGAEAAGLELAGLEERLTARGREIARLLLQDHLDARAAAEPRLARVAGPDGITRTWAEAGRTRQLSTVLGPVVMSRIAYRAPGACRVHPADAQLGLPAGRHSHGLAQMVACETVRGSLAAACAQVT